MRRGALLLAPIVLLAAVLRFSALDWGLRHTPHNDERSFVENAARMIRDRSLDHRFYEYPALFLYLLVPVQAAAGVDGPRAYVAARGLVAAFGVLSVALVGIIGLRRAGPWAGAAAALLLAVSPLEVVTAHEVRPDVALEAAALAALVALGRLGERAADDARAGLALALATSIKYSGILLAPAYLLARALAPGRRLRGVLIAAAVALAVGLLCTPYAWLHPRDFWHGVEYQRAAHYKGQPSGGFFAHLALLAGAYGRALGALGAALAPLAFLARRREWRTWAPWALYPLTIVAVFAGADLIYERHVIPSLGAVALLTGLVVAWAAARHAALGALLLALAVAPPLARSWDYLRNVAGRSPRDLVLDYAILHLPKGALILDTRAEDRVGFRQNGFEVIVADERRGPLDELLAAHVDAILTGIGQARRFGDVLALYPTGDEVNTRFGLKAVAAERRPRYAALPFARVRAGATAGAERLPLLADGRLDTVWSNGGPQRAGQSLQLDFDAPVAIGRLELSLGPDRRRYARDLRVWASADGHEWRRSADVSGRGPVEEQDPDRPASQVLLLEPQPVLGLRLVLGADDDQPWEVAELRLDVRTTSPTSP